MSPATGPLLAVEGLTKTFPGVRALDGVSVSVSAGEVVALLGHNGSGKSTLIKVLAGVYRTDHGSVMVAEGVGVHFIHQDLGLVPTLTALENLDLSRPLGGGALRPVDRRGERERALALLERFGSTFDLDAPVARLTPAERSIVAIARALDRWTSPRNVLILDEPTAALHGEEVERLLAVVRQVADDGAGIVYVSHRLDEVVRLADRVVVLRDGAVAAERSRGEYEHDDLVTIIAGRSLREASTAAGDDHLSEAPERLVVSGLRADDLHGVDLTVRAGEIVGVCGLVGSGMERLAGALFGAAPRTDGTVLVDGAELRPSSPSAAIAAGMAFVPADRRRHGAVVTMNARENLTLPRVGASLRSRWRMDHRAERTAADHWMRSTGVRPHTPERGFALFSGGNQQKIVLAKWLRMEPTVMLLEEPTQGVDVGAKAGIYELLARAAASGAGVLVASSDAKELAAICDRVVVLDHGVVTAVLTGDALDEQRLVHAVLSGVHTQPAESVESVATPAAHPTAPRTVSPSSKPVGASR